MTQPTTRADRLESAFDLAREHKLKPCGFCVFLFLASKATSKGVAWPLIQEIADACMVCTRQVKREIELLESLGLLKRKKSNFVGAVGIRSVYFLAVVHDWENHFQAFKPHPVGHE